MNRFENFNPPNTPRAEQDKADKESFLGRMDRSLRVKQLRQAREKDFAGDARIGQNDLGDINRIYDQDFYRIVERAYAEKNNGQKDRQPIRILDIGPAGSTFLEQLKKRFRGKVEAHSLDVKPGEDVEGVERHVFHVESMTKKIPAGYFDVITDTRGGIFWASDTERALDELYSVLAEGGKAYIHPKPILKPTPQNLKNLFHLSDWIDQWAERTGAKVEVTKTRNKLVNNLILEKIRPIEDSK